MTRSFSTKELSRALRADTPCVDDELFVVTLAQVARTTPARSPGRGISRGLKVGVVAASIVVTAFGAAHASGLLSTPPEPAITPPSDHGLQTPVDRLPGSDTLPRPSEQRSAAKRDLSGPDSDRPGSSLPSPKEDRAEEPEPDDTTAPPSGTDTPSGSEKQDHDNDESENTDAPDDSVEPDDTAPPEDSVEPDDTDRTDGSGADGEVDESDRTEDDSEHVDDALTTSRETTEEE